MASDPSFDDLVSQLRADNVSGASELARTAAEVLCRAAAGVQAGSVEELRRALHRVGQRILETQPSMAPLVTLVHRVLGTIGAAGSVEEAWRAAASAAEDFGGGLEARTDAVVASAAGVEVTCRRRGHRLAHRAL